MEKTDPASGRSYYINPETRVTTWQRPPAAANSSLSDGWMEKADPASGRRYYVNHKLKRTQWERP